MLHIGGAQHFQVFGLLGKSEGGWALLSVGRATQAVVWEGPTLRDLRSSNGHASVPDRYNHCPGAEGAPLEGPRRCSAVCVEAST